MNTYTLVQIVIAILTVFIIIYGRFGAGGDIYTKSKTVLSDAIWWIYRNLNILFRKLNPYPFQSMLLQFTVIYLIFFTIFITHPLPILKRWPGTTDAVLISMLVFLIISLFIQFFVPIIGPRLPTAAQVAAGAGVPAGTLRPSIDHLFRNFGLYLGFLMGIFVIILCAIGISYLAAHHTTATLWISTFGIIMLSSFIIYILYSFITQFSAVNMPPFTQTALAAILFVPVSIYEIIAPSWRNTSPAVFVLLAIELGVLLSYFIIPLITNALYLKSPGNKDIAEALKMKINGIKNDIKKDEELLKDMKGGVDIDWSNVSHLSDDELRVKLFDAGYTTTNVDMMIRFVRKNQKSVEEILTDLTKLKAKEKNLYGKLEKDYTTEMLLRDPVYTDMEQIVGTFEDLKKGDDYNYQYTLSCWIMVHQQGPNHALSYNKFSNLLNYGNKPSILYNVKKRTLRIIMLSGKTKKIIYESTNFPLQKWNNVVMSYDKGTFDIFINGKLIASHPGIVPYIKHDNVIIGENDGISGGICNVVYYSGNLSQARIHSFYNLLKDRNPPVVPAIPLYDSFENLWKKITKKKNDIEYSVE